MSPEGPTPRRLLVVDDDSVIRTLLHAALERKYDVLCVPNGPDVPGLIEKRRPDLVLLDINMPGSDGYSLCSAIRNQSERLLLPILFMTVCHYDKGFFDGLRTGGNALIRKPFELSVLKGRIDALLRPPAPSI